MGQIDGLQHCLMPPNDVHKELFIVCVMVSTVRNIQSTMLRQISNVVDEVSDMTEPDVISSSPQQSQLEYGSSVMLHCSDF